MKKLTLNKEVVAKLDNALMKELKGGISADACITQTGLRTCQIYCATNFGCPPLTESCLWTDCDCNTAQC